MRLEDKKVSEIISEMNIGKEIENEPNYIKGIILENLRQWAWEIVKEREERFGNINMDDISIFLINRFELKKRETNNAH